MAKLGYAPPVVDQMELWQAATLLGVDEGPVVAEGQDTFLGRPITPADRERLERFSTTGTDDPDITSQVMRQMGISPV